MSNGIYHRSKANYPAEQETTAFYISLEKMKRNE